MFERLTRAEINERRAADERLRAVMLAALVIGFLAISTLIIAFDSVFPDVNEVATLREGVVARGDIRAPISLTYVSAVLTERRRQLAIEEVSAVYDPPDPAVSRQQISLLGQVIDYVTNVRADPFASPEQKADDLNQITALTLEPGIVQAALALDDDTWRAAADEMTLVLERVMRESIRQADVEQIAAQLPTQVSVRFNTDTAGVVVAFVSDLLRPNRFPNHPATAAAQQIASEAVTAESRSFERGQVIIREGQRIDALDYESLQEFGLLDSPDRRVQSIIRAFLGSGVVLAGAALFVTRTRQNGRRTPLDMMGQLGFTSLLVALFLFALLGARLFYGDAGQIFVYPAAGLAFVFVAIVGMDIAMIAVIGLAFLTGLIADNSLEVAALIGVGGLIGALSLKRSERLNSYFFAGVVVALANVIVVTLFHIDGRTESEGVSTSLLLIYAATNGLLTGMIALAVLYVITLLFNLPTSLKLVELSQPNQPLLQRLLREAPGTYQHSLQVANLVEQAADAVGANAALVRVAALYHDIGKTLNPAFFVENQADNVNPHDMLNDPYRSAAIIISHVTDGEKLARQYRLPQRVRDFILEHHGTTLVRYFYSQAVQQAGDDESVDIEQFKYPGPRPQTRETALLMLADSCESTVRAVKPTNKGEIAEIVGRIFDSRARDGQLDNAHLTLDDLATIREIFIEMLQAVFHPRINYPTGDSVPTTPSGAPAIDGAPSPSAVRLMIAADDVQPLFVNSDRSSPARDGEADTTAPKIEPRPDPRTATSEMRVALTQEIPPAILDDDDSPLPDVPPLRRTKPNKDDG